MRTCAAVALSTHVAVVAKRLEQRRKSVANGPPVNSVSRSANLSSVQVSVSIDVIQTQEPDLAFPTADTVATVGVYHPALLAGTNHFLVG
jgi:hypothetical protein